MKQSIKKNIFLNCLKSGINILFPIIVFPYVSRILEPVNIGKVNFASSVINYFIMIASLGIPSYGVLICAKEKNNIEKLKKIIFELLFINMLLLIFTYVILIVLVFLIPKFYENRSLILLYSISILFSSLGMEWLYSGLEDFAYITKRSLIFKVISLILTFGLVKTEKDYYIYAIILISATVGANFFNFIHARPYIKWYSIKELEWRKHVKPIITFFAASVAGTINANTDSVMLGFILGDYAVGIYNFSVKIKSFLVSIMTAALSVFIPRFATYVAQERWDKYKNDLRKVVILTMAIACALATFFSVFSKETILVLGGESYVDAQASMIVLSICVAVLGMTWSIGVGVLQPLGKEKDYAKVMGIACLINISLNFILIPKLKVVGAAIATLCTEISNAMLFYHYAKPFLGDCLKRMPIPQMIGCAIFSGFVVKFLSEYIWGDGLLAIGIYVLCFGGMYIFLILLLNREIREILFRLIEKR